MEIKWKIVFHQLKEPFKISHGTYLQRKALILSIEKERCIGYGECTEIDYYGINLDEFFQGKRVAVDLAGWIVQSNQCRAMSNKVNKPHLRNVFFRAAALQALNIHVRFND